MQPYEHINDDVHSLWNVILDKKPVDAVIIDFDFNLNMKQLIRAQIYLRDPKCLFLSCATDMILAFPIPILGTYINITHVIVQLYIYLKLKIFF